MWTHCRNYRWLETVVMSSADMLTFSAWSLLSLTVTAHGAPMYPDELEVRYVWDTAVPNGRYISPAGRRSWIEDGRPARGLRRQQFGLGRTGPANAPIVPGPTEPYWASCPNVLPLRMLPNSQTQLPPTTAWVQYG